MGSNSHSSITLEHFRPPGPIGIVTARFNAAVTERLREGARAELLRLGVSEEQIVEVYVPGAYEIPLAAKWLLEKNCVGVIALGAVIRGETTHYDYVCAAAERGCSQLQLEFSKPVVFGVLTTENEAQAFNRVGGTQGHKGIEAAQVLAQMIQLKNRLFLPTPQPKGDQTWPNSTQSP